METIILATRGSALALAQTTLVLGQCRALFPELRFEKQIIRTTGDKLQTISLANPDKTATKGLFTKELEVALLDGSAHLAVHSLKDLPTELPDGLTLGAALEREDVRDVFIYRKDSAEFTPALAASSDPGFLLSSFLPKLPTGATIATSSTRRQAQLLAIRPDLKLVPIRGNVGTRLEKLAQRPELHGLILAAAGLNRLGFTITAEGLLQGPGVPAGLGALHLSVEQMLPCVGQAAIGLEIRADNATARQVCGKLNHAATFHCVTAERAFLQAMGGGCLSPIAAYADLVELGIRLRAVSFKNEKLERASGARPVEQAKELGREVAAALSTS